MDGECRRNAGIVKNVTTATSLKGRRHITHYTFNFLTACNTFYVSLIHSSFGSRDLLRHRQTKSAINRFQHGLGHEDIEEQLHVERDNNERRRPTENFQPQFIGKLTEFLFLARETHQRPDRETKLHAENHLTGNEQLGRLALPSKTNDQHRGNNRNKAGN